MLIVGIVIVALFLMVVAYMLGYASGYGAATNYARLMAVICARKK